jgi:K+-transporting ATPase ATPase C chain
MGLFTLLTGVLYPVAIWIACHDLFAFEAEGSLLTNHGKVVGSRLIGQQFQDPGHLWGRLSATGGYAYNPGASSGSNLGPLNPALASAAKARVDSLRAADPGLTGPIPVDLVTASGSGLDPDISLAAAHAQVGRIARARVLEPDAVRAIVDRHAQRPWLGVFGEARVNVLLVNLDLDGIPATDRGAVR